MKLSPAPQWTEVTQRENTDFECLAEARAFQGCSPYGNAILASACEAITTAPNGKQETTLNNRSYQVGRYVGGGLIERDMALGSLMAAALGMPDYDEDEKWAEKDIHFKVTRAVQNGMKQPLDGEEPFRAMKEVHRRYYENPELHEDVIGLLTALNAQRDAGDCESDYLPEADPQGEHEQPRAEALGGEATNKADEPWLQPGETRLIRRMGNGLPPPVPFLVDGLFHEVGTGIIAAKYSGGKTFVAMSLAASVANEEQQFAGREVLRRGAVLWLAAEGEREVDKRIRAAVTALECDPDRQPIYVQTAGVPKLLAQGGEAAVMKIVRQAERAAKAEIGVPLVLVVFDTMIKSAGYRKSESDAVDVNAMIQAMDNISILAKCFVLTLDHMGKDEDKGARGSSDKPSSVDVYMEIKSRGKRFILDAIKIKGEQGEEQINFGLVTADLEDGQQTAVVRWEKWVKPEGAERSLNGNAQVLYACLCNVIARDGEMRILLHSDPMRRCVQRGQVFEEFSKRHKGTKRHDMAFDRSWKELVRAKLVTTAPNKDGFVETQDWVYLEGK
jgi:AAA domain